MAQKLIQVHLTLKEAGDAYLHAIAPLAPTIADLAGLQWKIWLLNDAASEAGGIYLFADESSAQAFLTGPLIAQLQQMSCIGTLSTQQFDVLDTLTAMTRGPIAVYARGL
jgi:hypothetical protein